MSSRKSHTGRPKRSAFEILQYRVAEAHWRWRVWKQLYVADSSSPHDVAERRSLMMSAAPSFFSMLHDVLLQDIVLRICKLFDPPEGGPIKRKRVALSLAAAREHVAGRLPQTAIAEISKRTLGLERLAKPLAAWRNRLLAHDDERTAIGKDSLPSIQFDRVEKCLEQAIAIMTLLDPESPGREYAYDGLIAHGDGDSLIYQLQCSARYHKICLTAGRRPLSEME